MCRLTFYWQVKIALAQPIQMGQHPYHELPLVLRPKVDAFGVYHVGHGVSCGVLVQEGYDFAYLVVAVLKRHKLSGA